MSMTRHSSLLRTGALAFAIATLTGCATIKGWFDGMIGPNDGTHPFFQRLPPSQAQYCR